MADTEAEQRAYYRMLHNDRLSSSELIDTVVADCVRQVEPGAHYLIFQDTTQPNLERHRSRIKPHSGLGTISDDRSLGFFLHAALVMRADTSRCIGYSYIKTWAHDQPKVKCQERDYKKEPIEIKESYRWLECVERSRQTLDQAGMLTVISDREGDIFEVFERLPPQTHLLVRSKAERNIYNERGQAERLSTYIARQAVCGTLDLAVSADPRKPRQGRTAQLEIRIGSVGLLTPLRLNSKSKEPLRTLYVVEARETAASCPAAEDPIHWILLTTHPVNDLADAQRLLGWYKGRWNAEQVFRLAKRQGFNVEELELENGQAIIKAAIVAIHAASVIILLHQASKQPEPLPLQGTFTADQQQCLATLNQRMQGRTPKQMNPYEPQTVQWAYWVLARLGGWKPHEKQAGVITLFRGWQQFQQLFYGWQLARDVS
jgi:hypothetical protein